MIEPYTVALTSCERFDLLERTLTSLLPRLDGSVAEIIVAEDSGNADVKDIVSKFGCDIRVIVNDPPIGQTKSIDRLYSQVATEWVFHCEDDWEFFGTGFIEKSFALLKENEWLSMVNLREISSFGGTEFGPERVSASGIRHRVANDRPRWLSRFCGMSFNPGLRRMAHYRMIGPYADLKHQVREVDVSLAYRDMGYRTALLADPSVRHIGDGRHIADPFRPRVLRYRLRRSVLKRWMSLQDRWDRISPKSGNDQ